MAFSNASNEGPVWHFDWHPYLKHWMDYFRDLDAHWHGIVEQESLF